MRASTEAESARLGVRERILFAGVRSDVPRLLCSFDVFLFPSLHEGLPLAGLEAQAAALPVVASDAVTRELAIVPSLFTWRSLSEPPDAWAESVIAAQHLRPASNTEALRALECSAFSVHRSLQTLESAYGLR